MYLSVKSIQYQGTFAQQLFYNDNGRWCNECYII